RVCLRLVGYRMGSAAAIRGVHTGEHDLAELHAVGAGERHDGDCLIVTCGRLLVRTDELGAQTTIGELAHPPFTSVPACTEEPDRLPWTSSFVPVPDLLRDAIELLLD